MNIDYNLLEQKKLTILSLIITDKYELDEETKEDLNGIVNLIDALEDKKTALIKWVENEKKEQEFEIEKRAEKLDFNKEDFAELYSCDIDHDDFDKYSQEELQNHNFDLGMFKAYTNILNKLKND